MFKTVYVFDDSGVFLYAYPAQESPLESGVFITPTNSTDVPPPAVPLGCVAAYESGAWVARPVVLDDVQLPALKPLDEIKVEALAAVREARKPVFYTLAGMQSEALATGDSATATAIVAIQQALKDLPETDLSACTNAAEVGAAFVAAWQSIKELAPANVVSAFNEVLA